MLRHLASSGFGRLGLVLAAPFALLALGFGALALYQLTQPGQASAAHYGAYALLFMILGGVMLVATLGLGRMVDWIARDDG